VQTDESSHLPWNGRMAMRLLRQKHACERWACHSHSLPHTTDSRYSGCHVHVGLRIYAKLDFSIRIRPINDAFYRKGVTYAL